MNEKENVFRIEEEILELVACSARDLIQCEQMINLTKHSEFSRFTPDQQAKLIKFANETLKLKNDLWNIN